MFKWMVAIFILVLVAGIALPRLSRWIPLGRLPGDIQIRWRGREYQFPFATTVLLSLLLSLILHFF